MAGFVSLYPLTGNCWIPACAGMTRYDDCLGGSMGLCSGRMCLNVAMSSRLFLPAVLCGLKSCIAPIHTKRRGAMFLGLTASKRRDKEGSSRFRVDLEFNGLQSRALLCFWAHRSKAWDEHHRDRKEAQDQSTGGKSFIETRRAD